MTRRRTNDTCRRCSSAETTPVPGAGVVELASTGGIMRIMCFGCSHEFDLEFEYVERATGYFYFVAQTGLSYRVPPKSNFYAYRLPSRSGGELVRELEGRSTLGPHGLGYSKADLEALAKADCPAKGA